MTSRMKRGVEFSCDDCGKNFAPWETTVCLRDHSEICVECSTKRQDAEADAHAAKLKEAA